MSSWSAYVLPGAQSSTIQAADGREYQILLAIPRKPPPPTGFPVIYLLDANALFGTMVEALRMSAQRSDATGVPPAVIVGVAYPGVDLYDRERRTFDYTFGPPAQAADDPSFAVGGGAAFLDLLETRIKPRVQAETLVDRSRQTLFGHSLGGLFSLSVLTRSPRSFQMYIASSPSIWWDPGGLSEGISQLTDASQLSALLCVGEYEQTLAPWQDPSAQSGNIARRRRERAMLDNARMLAALLQNTGVRSEFREFSGEDHASVPLLAINRGIRFALQQTAQH